jgi:hypothetical protein
VFLPQVGQATTIHHWVYEDGTEGGPAASPPVEPTERPTDEELQKAGWPIFVSVKAVEPHGQGFDGCCNDVDLLHALIFKDAVGAT